MSGALLVGVDLGTTSTKAAIFEVDGRERGAHRVSTRLHEPKPGHVEQDPRELETSVLAAIRGAVDEAGVAAGDVAGIAIGGQMAGLLGVDGDLEPTTPYDSWLDARCAPQLQRLDSEHGDRLVALSGCPPMVNLAPKLAWWREEAPAAFAATAAWLVPGAWVAARLCGLGREDAFIDRTYLHMTGLADAAAGAWSAELCTRLGVAEATLPRIVEPTEAVGSLAPAAARATGLRAGTPVAAGLGDTAASVLGAGVVAAGTLLDSAGTAACLCASGTEFRPDVANRTLILMRGALPEQWVSLAYLAGGSVLAWLARLFAEPEDATTFERIIALAAAAEPRASELLFVPHLDGRILPSAPAMRGAWVGLRRDHERGHLCRAALEAVALEYAGYLRVLRELAPDLELAQVRVAGGGGRSAWWNAVKAAALGLPFARLPRDELGCWGAALCAAAAVGAVDDLAAAAAATATPEGEIVPDAAQQARLQRLAPTYRGLTDALAGSLDALTATPTEVLT